MDDEILERTIVDKDWWDNPENIQKIITGIALIGMIYNIVKDDNERRNNRRNRNRRRFYHWRRNRTNRGIEE